jgi:hypothetical protein
MPEPSILDARLAEIDRRLRMIQSGLEPVQAEGDLELDPVAQALEEPPLTPPTPLRSAPSPARADESANSVPGSGDTAALIAHLHELGEAHERLLELHRELLSQYAELLERRAGKTTAATSSEAVASVTAGPFTTPAAVREFQRALSSLPGVTGVSVREFVGTDRVALDVRLAGTE